MPSGRRVATLGKYLVALAESMDTDFDRPSVKRRRLHVLLIASDVIHHSVTRQRGHELIRSWDSHLPAMVATASTFEKCPKHLQKVRNLIALWEEREYLPTALITRLRDSFTQASDRNSGTRIHMSEDALKLAKEAPYVMPSSHGDSSTAWNHLPAASWLAQLLSDPNRPMRRDHIRPAQLAPALSQENFVNRVRSTLSAVEALFQEAPAQTKTNLDFTLLGEVQKQDGSSEHDTSMDTYWGWSRIICHNMKERRQKAASKPPSTRRSRSRSPYRSSSANRSRRSPKRFKRSSRSRSRDNSRSPRRRRSPGGLGSRDTCRDRPGNSSYSRSRSPAPPRGRSDGRRSYNDSMSRPSSRSSSRSESGPPRRRMSHSPAPYDEADRRGAQQAPSIHHHQSFPAMPPQGPGGFPVPPPPPPVGYQGIFLPPPPPPPQGWNHPNHPGPVAPPMMGGGWVAGPMPPHPPPPMPSPYDAQQQHGGRGSVWSGGGGRGYRGRGRGGNGRGGNGRGAYGYGPR